MEKEFKDMLQVNIDAINAINEVVERHGKKIDAIDEEVFNKASKVLTDNVEKMQELDQKVAAFEQRQKDVELMLAKGKNPDQEYSKEEREAFSLYLRKGTPMDEKLYRKGIQHYAEVKMLGATEQERKVFVESEMNSYKDMSAGSNADGGFTVIPEYDMSMRTRLFETSPMRGVSNVQTTGNSSVVIVLDDDEAAAGHVGETDARPETNTPQIGQATLYIAEVYAKPRATQTIIDDSPWNIASYLESKAVDKINRILNNDYVNGNGSSKAKGFLQYAAWVSAGVYERNKIEQRLGSDSTAGFNADDLIDLQTDLHDEYQNGAVWACRRKTFAELLKLKDANGQYLLDRQLLFNGGKRVILGSDLVLMADMPAVATGALSIAYGNFKAGYTIVDRIGIRVLRDPYSSKPYIEFYTTMRSGGGVTNFEAIKLLKMNTVA